MDAKSTFNFSGLMFAMNDHYLNHLIRLYKLFDGDMELCIVLGEIGHYNARLMFPDFVTKRMTNDEFLQNLKGCNANSVSMSSGIPRETVRRKIKKLIEMGYVAIDEKKQLTITHLPREELGEFTKESLGLLQHFVLKLKQKGHFT